MATKTISIELDVYERLRSLKATPSESFSQVLRRELPGPDYWTAKDLLNAIDSGKWTGLGLTEESLSQIEEAESLDLPPIDSWNDENEGRRN